MKIGAVTSLPESGSELARRVRLMDKAGFDSLWMYETYFNAEASSRAGFIAACTEKAKIACGVMNPYSRHPGLIALTAATLDRISNGRLILVMGAGGKEWTEGILGFSRMKPTSNIVNTVEVVRKMLAGGTALCVAPGFSIKNAKLDEPSLRSRIPIYLTAEREKMLRTVAQIADGIWLFQMPSVGYIKWAAEIIKETRHSNEPVEIGSVFPLRITDNPEKAIAELKPWMAFYLSLPAIGDQYVRLAGYDGNILDPIRSALKTGQLANPHDAFKAGGMDEAVKHVPSELIENSSIIGSPAHCRERLAELEQAGLTFTALSFQTRFDDTIRRIEEIIPN